MSDWLETEAERRVAASWRYAESLARADALAAIARDVPDPETYARQLSLDLAELLLGATGSGSCCRVSAEAACQLRPLGLVEARTNGRFLTAFGQLVLIALREDDA